MLSNVYRVNPQDGYYFHQQNNVKKIKANKDQDFCLYAVVALNRFKIFLNSPYEEELTVSFIRFLHDNSIIRRENFEWFCSLLLRFECV